METDSQQISGDYFTRLNYGMIGIKTHPQICVATGFITHIFHIPLPRQAAEVIRRTNSSSRTCGGLCTDLEPVAAAVRDLTDSLRTSVTDLVAKATYLIPLIGTSTPKRRPTRGLINALGEGLSWFAGTATNSDIESLKREIDSIKQIAASEAADSGSSRESMIQFTKIANDRLDSLHKVLSEEHHTLQSVESTVRSLKDSLAIEYNAIQFIAMEMSSYVKTHDSVQRLEEAIEKLVAGQLTPGLIPINDLEDLLRNLSQNVELTRERRLSLCYTTPQEIYRSKLFDYGRINQEVYVRIKIPVTAYASATIYKTMMFDVPVQGSQGMVTRLRDIPARFIVSFDSFGELSTEPHDGIIDCTAITWHRRNSESCIRMLFKDDTPGVKQYCDFTIKKGRIQPTYTGIARGVYVVEGISNLYFESHSTDKDACTHTSELSHCNPCLIHLNCGCTLKQRSELRGRPDVVIIKNQCVGNVTTNTVYHAVNLAMLNEFYDMGNITMDGKTLLRIRSKLSGTDEFKLPLFGYDNVDKLLSADETASYSLKRLAENLKNNTVIYHTASEAMIAQYLANHEPSTLWGIDKMNIIFVGIGILFVLLSLSLISSLHNRRALRDLNLKVVGMAGITMIPHVKSLRLRPEFFSGQLSEMNVTNSAKNWIEDMMKHIIREDNWQWVTIAFILGITILISVRMYFLSRRFSFVYLHISRGTFTKNLKYFKLADVDRLYTISTTSEMEMEIKEDWLFGYIHFLNSGWYLKDTLSGSTVMLPSRCRIPFGRVKLYKEILKDTSCVITLMIVRTHSYEVNPRLIKHRYAKTTEKALPHNLANSFV